jgi:hypothetical protein
MNLHRRFDLPFRRRQPQPRPRQRVFSFIEESIGRERLFKRVILGVGVLIVAVAGLAMPTFHYRLTLWASEARDLVALGLFGFAPDRARIEAEWRVRRRHSIEQTRKHLARFYRNTTAEMRALFQVVGMSPENGLVVCGRADEAFVISSLVFELDEHGRSYRFRPNVRSIWLRQITLRNGPFGMFQVLDAPTHWAAALGAGAIVDRGSAQQTNSWGLRGPEPDPSAPVRGIVLGDSFMQGMFGGDDDTPPVQLERCLRSVWKVPVSILNTGHIGYSPEQYYYSLCEYGERMRPRFVVVSVCPNDFGDGYSVLAGKGDWFGEAEYWLDQIQIWCRAHPAVCVLVPVPTRAQVEGRRVDDVYPGRVCRIVHGAVSRYCDPLNEFIDEDLRLTRIARRIDPTSHRSFLYNYQIGDDHFSPRGAALWARIVGRRLEQIIDPSLIQSTKAAQPSVEPDSRSRGKTPFQ